MAPRSTTGSVRKLAMKAKVKVMKRVVKAAAMTSAAKKQLPKSLPPGRRFCGRNGVGPVIGVDEAGRGPWAGPVVAAAVAAGPKATDIRGVTDSKKLNEGQREAVYEQLVSSPHISWSVAIVSRARIDKKNILEAAHEAMALAVRGVQRPSASKGKAGGKAVPRPGKVLVDGNLVPKLLADMPCQPLVGGDRRCFEVAAASVLAKVTRDRLMEKLHRRFPAYGFAAHKGYGTAAHQAALSAHGPCAEHRRTFEPVKGFLETGSWPRRGKK
eukprot:TRINITY_DN33883_c0_g2_i1.p1 TRINITY_DN33883_c0_g2~~TRINITY_DN33883_c0_g2_i1.p1  ORF type:complete len:282 (-),score=56.57 TRINITY_DN33883_c0_g2_i1:58-867(-)